MHMKSYQKKYFPSLSLIQFNKIPFLFTDRLNNCFKGKVWQPANSAFYNSPIYSNDDHFFPILLVHEERIRFSPITLDNKYKNGHVALLLHSFCSFSELVFGVPLVACTQLWGL